ncbi:MAG: hypothetical protein LZF62_480327 [Nitrospira sp.]|nr:MAG: hypothetical protein LZF62_480327 [Nitrospira sp.]
MSLLERTRQEKGSLKIGFDWVMFNLAIARDWTPVRLPFIRQSEGGAPKTKPEAEYGIDMSFLLPNKDTLVILVLKDEALTYSNWTGHNFDSDIRMAAFPDLSRPELAQVKLVQIILAYNKDEDDAGVKAYTNLINGLGYEFANNITREFHRWNLTKITGLVEEHLMTPDLLPQNLSGLLHYICSQISDFEYESSEWANQLAPNWAHFLDVALSEPLDERKIRLVPVALFILHRFKKNSRSAEAGWITLIETAMLMFWKRFATTQKPQLKQLIEALWITLYLGQLEQYFVRNHAIFTVEHGFQHSKDSAFALSAIADAVVAFWYIGRLGIYTLGSLELLDATSKEHQEIRTQLATRSAEVLQECLQKNPAALRPLIDLHHIELFLAWYMLWVSGQMDACYLWLSALEGRLLVRKAGNLSLPFIESRNRLDLVVEHAATNVRPPDYSDRSSYLLLMILELCFSLPTTQRDELIYRYVQRLIKGIGDDGKHLEQQSIDLVGWAPPRNWINRIFGESVSDGTGITLTAFDSDTISTENSVRAIQEHVARSRVKFPFSIPDDLPKAALVLACIRHRSPLPSEFWRSAVFPVETNSTASK